MTLVIVPVTFRQAASFVAAHHRHHKPPRGMKFALGLEQEGTLVGVAMVGRPIAPLFDDGRTAEVNRTCVLDNVPNANSMLYGAAWRCAKAMGYRRLITYTQEGESGASLRGAGWRAVRTLRPREAWDCPSRPRRDNGVNGIARTLWEIGQAG